MVASQSKKQSMSTGLHIFG
uniref:O-linked n-acetylglucosamine transferase, ogt, putative n=1 Tax=Arundo donax TaxID=35708 RepID=A0A0A9AT81_ARUDO